MEQLSAPSADPENQARARSSLGSNSKKEAWLEAAGGTRYASWRPSAVFLILPSNIGWYWVAARGTSRNRNGAAAELQTPLHSIIAV